VIVSVVFAILLAIGALAFVAAPLLRGRKRSRGMRQELREALLEKNAAIQLLHDLEHDRNTGKLDEEDYLEQKTAAELRAIAALRRLDEMGAPSEAGADPIEMLIREERRRLEKEARS
jgi:cytochrome c-type biogenesis protein CcmI